MTVFAPQIADLEQLRRELDNLSLRRLYDFSHLLLEANAVLNNGIDPQSLAEIKRDYGERLRKFIFEKKEILDDFKKSVLNKESKIKGKIEILERLIGKTPLVKLPPHLNPTESDIYLKLEYLNPFSNSLKDRAAVGMFKHADLEMRRPMDASSGRLAEAISVLGYLIDRPAVVIVSKRVSDGTKIMLGLLKDFFDTHVVAEVEDFGICSAFPTDGAIAMAKSYSESPKTKNMVDWCRQFWNEHNAKAQKGIIRETLGYLGRVDSLNIMIGSGGTISAAAQSLYEMDVDVELNLVMPQREHHQFGGRNIYEAWKPEIWAKSEKLYPFREIVVSDEDAYCRTLALNENFVPSGITGGSVYHSLICYNHHARGKVEVGVIPDGIDKYPIDFINYKINVNGKGSDGRTR